MEHCLCRTYYPASRNVAFASSWLRRDEKCSDRAPISSSEAPDETPGGSDSPSSEHVVSDSLQSYFDDLFSSGGEERGGYFGEQLGRS